MMFRILHHIDPVRAEKVRNREKFLVAKANAYKAKVNEVVRSIDIDQLKQQNDLIVPLNNSSKKNNAQELCEVKAKLWEYILSVDMGNCERAALEKIRSRKSDKGIRQKLRALLQKWRNDLKKTADDERLTKAVRNAAQAKIDTSLSLCEYKFDDMGWPKPRSVKPSASKLARYVTEPLGMKQMSNTDLKEWLPSVEKSAVNVPGTWGCTPSKGPNPIRRRLKGAGACQTIGIASAGLLLTGFIVHRIWSRWTAKRRSETEVPEPTGEELA